MTDDADVPPLEDLSSVLQKVLSIKDIKTDKGSSSKGPVTASFDSCVIDGRTPSTVSEIHHLNMLRYVNFGWCSLLHTSVALF